VAERLRALEVKNAKLEDDFRAVAAARDQLRRKLSAAEDQQQQLQKQTEELQAVTRERDELRQQLVARTAERDALTGQFDQVRKGLKDLLGQAEASIPRPSEPVTSAVEVTIPGKS
jgi:predicted RNase H-like nuclease (RuvC/YqgF family)